MSQSETAPAITTENLHKISLGSSEGQQFAETLGKFHMVFIKDIDDDRDAWQMEWDSLKKSATAMKVYRQGEQTNDDNRRWKAVFTDCMEKRTGKPITNTATAASYTPAVEAIINLAKSIKGGELTAGNRNFNMATFINCCLDRMEVAEGDPEVEYTGKTARLDDIVHFNASKIDPARNPDIVKQMVDTGSIFFIQGTYGSELGYMVNAKSDSALREFIRTGSRTRAMAVYLLEMIYLKGPLTPKEVKQTSEFARKVYVLLAGKCLVSNNEPTSPIGRFVERALEIAIGYERKVILTYCTERLRLKKDTESGGIGIGNHRLRIVKRTSKEGEKFFLVNPQKEDFTPGEKSARKDYEYMIELKPGQEYNIGERSFDSHESKSRRLIVNDGEKKLNFSDMKVSNKTDYDFSSFNYWSIAEHQCALKIEKDGIVSITNQQDNIYHGTVHWNENDFDDIRPSGYLHYHPKPTPDKLLPRGWEKIDITDLRLQDDLKSDAHRNAYASCYQFVDKPSHCSDEEFCQFLHDPNRDANRYESSDRGIFLAFSEAMDLDDHSANVKAHYLTRKANNKFQEEYHRSLDITTNQERAVRLALLNTLSFLNRENNIWFRDTNDYLSGELIEKIKLHLSLVVLGNDGTYTIVRVGPSPRIYKTGDKDITLVAGDGKTKNHSVGILHKLKESDFEIITGKLEPTEHLIVCSRNVWEKITPDMLQYFTRISKHPQEAVRFLSTLAYIRGAKENIAIAVLQQK